MHSDGDGDGDGVREKAIINNAVNNGTKTLPSRGNGKSLWGRGGSWSREQDRLEEGLRIALSWANDVLICESQQSFLGGPN